MTANELAQAVALVFRRRGATLSATDFKHVASFDLKWFPPREAARLLDLAQQSGLVAEDGGRLKAAFDVHGLEVPLDFRPGPDLLERGPRPLAAAAPPRAAAPPPAAAPTKAAPPTGSPVERLAEHLGMPPADLIALAEQERERSGGLLQPTTAALLAARRRGVDVRPYL